MGPTPDNLVTEVRDEQVEEIDVEEVITLSGFRYSTESRTEDGWTQTDGILERRSEQVPVEHDRRQR